MMSMPSSLPAARAHLPGGLTSIVIDGPPIKDMVTHAKARKVHGILSEILRVEFDEKQHTVDSAAFAIIPRTEPHIQSWDIWWADARHLALANQRRAVTWMTHRERRVLSIGPIVRLRHPPVLEARHYFVTLRTCTPLIVMTDQPKRLATKFEDEDVKSVLRNVAKRIRMGTPLGELMVMQQDLHWIWCEGFHHAKKVGLMGSLMIRMDQRALWLLRVAEMIGFGGMTSIGFGRFLIKEVV